MNYPNEKFKSYLECDEDFVYNYLKKKLNITPFWSANDFTTVTKQRLIKIFLYHCSQIYSLESLKKMIT